MKPDSWLGDTALVIGTMASIFLISGLLYGAVGAVLDWINKHRK